MEALAGQQQKYKNRLGEKATIYTEQPSVHLEHTPDLFEGNGGSNEKYPYTNLLLTRSLKPVRICLNGSRSAGEVVK